MYIHQTNKYPNECCTSTSMTRHTFIIYFGLTDLLFPSDLSL